MGKNKGGDKAGDKKAAAGAKGKGGKEEKKEVKGAQSINVRHILVRPPFILYPARLLSGGVALTGE